MVEGLKDSYSVVLSPKEHPSTEEEIGSVTEYLKPEYAYKLSAVTLEDFVDAMIQYLPEYYAQVYERFRGDTWSLGRWNKGYKNKNRRNSSIVMKLAYKSLSLCVKLML